MRLGVDTGGTFTDLVVETDDGGLLFTKSPTTPDDPVVGVLDVLKKAAADRGEALDQMLAKAELFIHGTTHAINAVVTGKTARTALLTTEGHEDILRLREGGRSDPFDYSQARPKPYIPRHLTFGIRERVLSDGRVALDLDEAQVEAVAKTLKTQDVEAIAVCLLWSIINPAHERRIREILEKALPSIPITLSHELNPTMREYRRASATAIDASLKPLMGAYLSSLDGRLRENGFAGRLLIVTSGGGVLDAAALAKEPIHAINSGPAMAPVAARYYAMRDTGSDTSIVGDVGGTTLDIALIRRGRIGRTREKWIGAQYIGHMTGFHSVDITSVASGGGSIASVDKGGLLTVGPESAGSNPGPACFGRGGAQPTVTDANLVLGRLDADYFLGGAIVLDVDRARAAIEAHVAKPLGMTIDEAASAILNVTTENMMLAIEDITVNQGVDPASAVYVAAGGAAGFNAVSIGRRLGCRHVVIPESVATLSAAGALMSDLTADFSKVFHTNSTHFDVDRVNEVITELAARAQAFIDSAGTTVKRSRIEFSFEARYASQIWEIEVPMAQDGVDVDTLRADFEALHEELYAFSDPQSELFFTQWNARAICAVREKPLAQPAHVEAGASAKTRSALMPGVARGEVPVHRIEAMAEGMSIAGPAILESPLTTVVLDPGASAKRTSFGSVVITIETGEMPASNPQSEMMELAR